VSSNDLFVGRAIWSLVRRDLQALLVERMDDFNERIHQSPIVIFYAQSWCVMVNVDYCLGYGWCMRLN